jgi:4-amino-4-deoxy-L-arabinose transferase-like glycosyltransferase
MVASMAGLEAAVRPVTAHRIALGALVCAFFASNLMWVLRYRSGQPLDIDEAGFLGMSVLQYHAFSTGGVVGWFQQMELPSQAAPVTNALTSAVSLLVGPGPMAGFLTTLLLGVALVVASFWLGKLISGRADVALFTALLVATTPLTVREVRVYHFAIAASVAATIAVAALLRSKGLAVFSWSILFGAAAAVMVLCRTMTVAFLPGLFVPAVLVAVIAPNRRHRLRNLAASLVAFCVTALTWTLPSWKLAFAYLTGWGYGARSLEYGSSDSPFSISEWVRMMQYAAFEFRLPHLLLLLVGIIALFVLAVAAARRSDKIDLQSWALSPVFLVAFFVAEAILALRSSRNHGSEFLGPVVPALCALAALGLAKLLGRRFAGAATIVSAALIALIVPMFDPLSAAASPRYVEIPILGPVVAIDGRSDIELYEDAAGYGSSNPAMPLSFAQGAQWLTVNHALTNDIVKNGGSSNVVAFGFRHYMLNPLTVNLDYGLQVGRAIGITMVAPIVTGDNVDGYRTWLTRGDASTSCLLLTATGSIGEFKPRATSTFIEAAAKGSGFVFISARTLPDGRSVRLWRRPNTCY